MISFSKLFLSLELLKNSITSQTQNRLKLVKDLSELEIKQKEIDNIILQFGDDLLNKNNVYSKQTFKRLQSDVNIIFGQIDSKVEIINPHNDTDNKRRMYYRQHSFNH